MCVCVRVQKVFIGEVAGLVVSCLLACGCCFQPVVFDMTHYLFSIFLAPFLFFS